MKTLIVICISDTHRKGHMYTFRTTSNRQPKRKSAEATGAGDNNRENVTLEIKVEAGGPKKPLRELPPAPKKTGKIYKKNARP